MKKIKKLLSSNGAMSLYSIFTLMAAFFLVCTAVIFGLSRAGLFDIPHGTEQVNTTSPAERDGENANYEYVSEPTGGEAMAKLLSAYPFADNFYMEVYMMFATPDGFIQDDLRLWKSGNRYKLYYNEGTEQKKYSVVCDGKTVSYFSAADELVFSTDYSEAYAFENMAYVPAFCLFSEEEYTVTDCYMRDGEYIVEYTISSLSYADKVYISADSGIVRSVRTYCEGALVSRYDIGSYELNFDFSSFDFDM